MNIYVYSDESGVFDVVHNCYYVFGGIVFLDTRSRDECARKYMSVERMIRSIRHIPAEIEIKASSVSNKDKSKLFRATNNQIRFGVIIKEADIIKNIWESKKDKQRYLDYAYKMGIKHCFQQLIRDHIIDPLSVEHLHFFVDEHSTATSGYYLLQESLETEFKRGIYMREYTLYIPPLFPAMKSLDLKYCNSRVFTLVRAADVIANKIYYCAERNPSILGKRSDIILTYLPPVRV